MGFIEKYGCYRMPCCSYRYPYPIEEKRRIQKKVKTLLKHFDPVFVATEMGTDRDGLMRILSWNLEES